MPMHTCSRTPTHARDFSCSHPCACLYTGENLVRATLEYFNLPVGRFKSVAALRCCHRCSHAECHHSLPLLSVEALRAACACEKKAADGVNGTRGVGEECPATSDAGEHAGKDGQAAVHRSTEMRSVRWLRNANTISGKHADEVHMAWRHTFALRLHGAGHATQSASPGAGRTGLAIPVAAERCLSRLWKAMQVPTGSERVGFSSVQPSIVCPTKDTTSTVCWVA